MKKLEEIIDNIPAIQSIEVNHDLTGHYVKVEVDENLVTNKERNLLDETSRKDHRMRVIYFREY